uniref:Uncharacterized protein n=1 Tax=Setaria viridis TaxID=4556 RepID=A0A4U6THN9_SETVI|nr:hypothetical protein SEVIR_8G102300v2 [Setaria viridis]
MIINLLCIKSDGVSNEFCTAKESDGNQELTRQQNAVVKSIETNCSSEEFDSTEPMFRHYRVGIQAKDMIGLTLPPGIKEEDKFMPSNCKVQIHPWSRYRGAASP